MHRLILTLIVCSAVLGVVGCASANTPTNTGTSEPAKTEDASPAVTEPVVTPPAQPAPEVGLTDAEKWSSGVTVVVGQTTWEEYSQLLPTDDFAPSEMKMTGFSGDKRLWTTTFKDGSTANAIIGTDNRLESFDTDKP